MVLATLFSRVPSFYRDTNLHGLATVGFNLKDDLTIGIRTFANFNSPFI